LAFVKVVGCLELFGNAELYINHVQHNYAYSMGEQLLVGGI